MNSAGSFPELTRIEEKIRAGLSDTESLASRQVEEVFRPLPPGTDYLPSALFILACRSRGISSDGIMTLACALESFSLAVKMLIPLTGPERMDLSALPDPEHREGMALLVADGLMIMANRFLADLYSTGLGRLVPILGMRPREWIGQIESTENGKETIAVVQKSLSGTAVQAVGEIVRDTDGSTELIERVRDETDRLLSAYRKAEGRAERRSVVEAFEGLYGSIRDVGGHARPLARYVSLVRRPLSVTSSP